MAITNDMPVLDSEQTGTFTGSKPGSRAKLQVRKAMQAGPARYRRCGSRATDLASRANVISTSLAIVDGNAATAQTAASEDDPADGGKAGHARFFGR
ncbi:hypothetical protein [Burkholderia territorii]|uniref:hypothetical protein n=1 Tax=Burkholderia territorii TaxID=1503055 RepID=UPI0007BA8976|nr:hypothetical protein [Burkholderia territorii]